MYNVYSIGQRPLEGRVEVAEIRVADVSNYLAEAVVGRIGPASFCSSFRYLNYCVDVERVQPQGYLQSLCCHSFPVESHCQRSGNS